ncbi:hypothetical protein FIA58_012910 [Flavobacterium jejuense]|uniref:Uncharacterized protein n=1 Tax=Flavobacterium jejuense TaxID=1544455 RepID=A0ABX0IXV4_9FLAO|nr:hypothetical protein [Flavobacterium jejuense]NHN26580.1 hypothetical protein [Flavobacterium jejuense]
MQANNKKVSKTEETKIIEIKKVETEEKEDVKLENLKNPKFTWYVICKDGESYIFQTNTDDFDVALSTGNNLCRSLGIW